MGFREPRGATAGRGEGLKTVASRHGPESKRQERGVYATSSFASPQPNTFAIARKTLKRPEGRAPEQSPNAPLRLTGVAGTGTMEG
jgi:hypothetical protein